MKNGLNRKDMDICHGYMSLLRVLKAPFVHRDSLCLSAFEVRIIYGQRR